MSTDIEKEREEHIRALNARMIAVQQERLRAEQAGEIEPEPFRWRTDDDG